MILLSYVNRITIPSFWNYYGREYFLTFLLGIEYPFFLVRMLNCYRLEKDEARRFSEYRRSGRTSSCGYCDLTGLYRRVRITT